MYDPVLGRFLSSDLLVSDPENTQSYNRYTYCMNNPLKYVDLSGLFPIRRKDGTWYDQNIEYPYDRDEMEPWEVDMWFEINGFDPNLYNHDMTDCHIVFEIGEENKYAVKYYGYTYSSAQLSAMENNVMRYYAGELEIIFYDDYYSPEETIDETDDNTNIVLYASLNNVIPETSVTTTIVSTPATNVASGGGYNEYTTGVTPFNYYQAAFTNMENIGPKGGFFVKGYTSVYQSNGKYYIKTSTSANCPAADVFGLDVTFRGRTDIIVNGKVTQSQNFYLCGDQVLVPSNYSYLGITNMQLPSFGSVQLRINVSYIMYDAGQRAVPLPSLTRTLTIQKK